jgi:hypothetical protein
MRPDTVFDGDDLRRTDPKFLEPRFAQYLAAVERLDRLAQQRFGKRVIHLAVRWMLDQGITTALWGARHPDQLQPVDEVTGWWLDSPTKAEIDRILRETITDPVGPEFMAPPARSIAEYKSLHDRTSSEGIAMVATQLLLIRKVSGSGVRCRIGSRFRTCQRIKMFFWAW